MCAALCTFLQHHCDAVYIALYRGEGKTPLCVRVLEMNCCSSSLERMEIEETVPRRRCYSGYSRHTWSAQLPARDRHSQLVWVNRWYTPDNLRATAPVQRHKFLAQPQPSLSSVPEHWVPPSEAPLKSFSRAEEESGVFASAHSSRCEEWSTLRQMLPSQGHCVCHSPPKWGTGFAAPPSWSHRKPRRLPHINSPMTKSVNSFIVAQHTLFWEGRLNLWV